MTTTTSRGVIDSHLISSPVSVIGKTLCISVAIAVLTVTLLPNYALAAETNFTILVNTGVITRELDPYLAKAIDEMPSYSYSETGVALGITTPVTTPGKIKQINKTHSKVAQIAPAPLQILNSDDILTLIGEASYYSRAGCLGCNANRTMANGQPLDDNALTMAIGANLRHLVGRRARVTNLSTNMSINVAITDTGGFYQAKYGSRVADLTIATKQAIGMTGGVGQVRVEVF